MLILTVGCGFVDDSLTDCPTGVVVLLHYTLNSEDLDKFGDRVDHVGIFIFDSDGLFVKEVRKNIVQEELFKNLLVIDLYVDTYTIVAVGGYLKYYKAGTESSGESDAIFTEGLTVGETKLSEFRIKPKNINEEGVVTERIDDLFMGIEKNVVVTEYEVVESVIDFTLNSNSLNITFTGLDGVDYTPFLTSKNGVYNAENSIANELELIYMPLARSRTNVYEFRKLRLVKGVPVNVTLKDSSGNVISSSGNIDLLKYIMQSSPELETQEGLDRKEIYDIVLNFKSDNSDSNSELISITIGEWTVEIVKPVV